VLGSGVDVVVVTCQVEAVDAFGFTPAALAARAGHAEVAKQLGATAEAAAEVAAAAAAAKMLLVAPEECHAHMTHAAFVRSGPEPPPENDNRLTVLTHAAKCVSGLHPLRMVALDREGSCLSVCVLLQRRSSSSMEPQHVKTDSAQQKGWAGSRVLKSKLFQCGFARSRARKDGTWIPRIDEELYTAVRRGLRPRVVGLREHRGILHATQLAERVTWVEQGVKACPMGDILRVHDWPYIKRVQDTCARLALLPPPQVRSQFLPLPIRPSHPPLFMSHALKGEP